MENLIEVENLEASYRNGEPVLRDLDLEVSRDRDFVIIAGANGSGKSTLLRVLRGLQENYMLEVDGKVRINGIDPLESEVHELGEKIGMIFQRPSSQIFNSTVSSEVESGPIFLGKKWGKTAERRDRALKMTGIEDLRDDVTHWLSGGQKQKTVLASILAMEPEILLLDEPFSYLDPESRREILQALNSLKEEIKVVLVTHSLNRELMEKADHLVFLRDGKAEFSGDPDRFDINWMPEKVEKKETENTTALEIENLSVNYSSGEKALKDVYMEIPDSSITCLLGSNGSGKTTLAKACTKMVDYRGRIKIKNRAVEELRPSTLGKYVGLVTQDPADMLFRETVRKELIFGPKKLGMEDVEEKVERAMEKTGIKHLEDRDPSTLSTGQQRLVSIAVMLAMDSEIIFLDEPELALDPENLSKLLKVLKDLAEEKSIVVLTHELETFLPLTDHTVVLMNGEKIAEGKPRDVLSREIRQEAGLE
jgi:energy-coupling factor transporter ATP-binding protein EcfA2